MSYSISISMRAIEEKLKPNDHPITTEKSNTRRSRVVELTILTLFSSTNSPFSIAPDLRESILVTIPASILEVEDGSTIDDKCVKTIEDPITSE